MEFPREALKRSAWLPYVLTAGAFALATVQATSCHAIPIAAEPIVIMTRYSFMQPFEVEPAGKVDIGGAGVIDATTGTARGGEFIVRAPGDLVPGRSYANLFKDFAVGATIAGTGFVAVQGTGVKGRNMTIRARSIGMGGDVFVTAVTVTGDPPQGLVSAGGIGQWAFVTVPDQDNAARNVFTVANIGLATILSGNAPDPSHALGAATITQHLDGFPEGEFRLRPVLDLGLFTSRENGTLAFEIIATADIVRGPLWELHIDVTSGLSLVVDFASNRVLGLRDEDIEKEILHEMNPTGAKFSTYNLDNFELFDTTLNAHRRFGYTISTTALSMVEVPEPATLALLAFGLAALGFARRRRH